MMKDVVHSFETLKVLKALHDGSERTFSEIKRSTGLAGATISIRLKLLESCGYVERRIIKSWPPRTTYKITEGGRELYAKLVEEKLKPEIEEYAKSFPEEVYSIVKKYLTGM
jgi:DNA-binding HxlR family transcriptional regulator